MPKTYSCCYCKEKFNRKNLPDHIEKEHDDELPPNYTAYRMAYDIINDKKGYGECVICHSPTPWDEKKQKYNRLCGNPKCKKAIQDKYQKNMLKVYGKVHLLDDPHHQEKMLANRHISGKYVWSDGKVFTYTGSYERELMEFLDKGLEYDSNDILAPGPILEYEIDGVKRHWITDFMIIPYNLIIEVKDGGDNPNKRNMPVYRAKQLAKEKMITNMGTYSYIRLTNKDFSQLLGILAELKMNIVEEKPGPLYRIHEDFINTTIEDIIPVSFLNETVTTNIPDPLFSLANISISEHFIENPIGDLVYEVVIIKPKIITQPLIEAFSKHTNTLMSSIQKDLKNSNLQLESYWIDPNNYFSGIGIGLIL